MANGISGSNGNNGRRAVITKETLLPLGISIVLVLGALQLGRTWGAVDSQVSANSTSLEMIRTRVELVERGVSLCATKSEVRQLELLVADDLRAVREAMIKGGMQP